MNHKGKNDAFVTLAALFVNIRSIEVDESLVILAAALIIWESPISWIRKYQICR